MTDFELVEWSDLRWSVTPQTFVPRPSSLGFVEFVRTCAPPDIPLLIDMCCGSGAVGIAVYRSMPGWFNELLLLDSSDDALISAESNRVRYEVPGKALRWLAGEGLPCDEPAVVVCNPPFLPDPVSAALPEWERRCVAGGDDGLDVVRKCFESLAGTAHHLMLKCLTWQVERLRRDDQSLLVVHSEGEIAFSYWKCS